MTSSKPSKDPVRPVMIILTGGRSTPAILGALAVKPRAIELINSRDEAFREDEVRSALSSIAEVLMPTTSETVHAYDMRACYDACGRIIERIGDGPFVINLSSGTKIMALGAYEFAREHHLPALYVETSARQVLDLTTQQSFPMAPLDVESYLACFQRSPRYRFNQDALSCTLDQAVNVAGWVVSRHAPALAVLELIRRHGEGKAKRSCKVPNYEPGDAETSVWQRLVEDGLLESAEGKGSQFTFVVKSDADFEFLKGTWLELFVWNEARQQKTPDGLPVFDAARFNFEIPADSSGARKEIDVGLMVGGQLIHCSCKSGGKAIWSTAHLDELRSVSSLIGGRFCSRVFVTSKMPPSDGDGDWRDYNSFLEQAKDRQIVVIAGDRLAQIGTLLATEAAKPTYWRV